MQKSGQPESRALRINVEVIAKLGHLAIQRAYVFLGLGINAAEDSRLTDYILPALMQYVIVAPGAPDDKVQEFKEEFGKWIVANGLRELIEGFGLFLDEIYRAAILIKTRRAPDAGPDNARRLKSLHQSGVAKKITRLHDEFGIQVVFADHYHSLYAARNCFTHRRGVVAQRDCNDGDNLVISWRALDLSFQGEDGEMTTLPSDATEPFSVEKGALIQTRTVDRRKEFAIGSRLLLSPHDLTEICFTSQISVQETRGKLLEYAKSEGINVVYTAKGQEKLEGADNE